MIAILSFITISSSCLIEGFHKLLNDFVVVDESVSVTTEAEQLVAKISHLRACYPRQICV